MPKNLFLIGPSGCGKSTILRRLLGARMILAGGFLTERSPSGFILRAPSEDCGLPFIRLSPVPQIDEDVFRIDAVRLLQQSLAFPFAIIDETGGFELEISEFRSALYELLASDVPCIGVIKSPENFRAMEQRIFGIHSLHASALIEFLKQDSQTQLVPMQGRGDCHVETQVRTWIKEHFHEP